jgi:MFS superfamily sulfate permease-like transporter
MLRMLLVIVAAIVIVLVAMAIVKTFIWLAMIALIFGVICLALGVFRLGRRSGNRSHSRS